MSLKYKAFRLLKPLSLLSVAIFIAGCGGGGAEAEQMAAPPVEVITTVSESLQLTSTLPGRISPLRVAEVRARAAGIVLRRRFEEGAQVNAGQVLFEIDPAPFRAALAQAQAELSKAQSELNDARRIAERYRPLAQAKAISQQEYEAATTRVETAQGARQAAAAAVEAARIDLKHTTVTAPISGRIGRALVTEGALVGQGEATPMAVIQQVDKVYADFHQPVNDVLKLREALKNGSLSPSASAHAVKVRIDGTSHELEGKLLFSDITVDPTTSQVLIRGLIENPDDLLLPGMFVRVVMPQGADAKAILVPQRAVMGDGQGGQQVLIVDKDSVLQARAVRTGSMFGSRWQILEGLKPGDRVVVSSAALIPPGTPVEVKTTEKQSASVENRG